MAERRPLVLIDGVPRGLPSGDTLPEDPTLLKDADIGTTVCSQTDPRLSDARTPTAHTHTAASISNSTLAGRTLLTAADAAAQRTALDLVKQTAVSDTTAGRVALVDYIPRPTIDQIAGLAPTLDLDFERQVYRHYSPATGLREKPLSDIVTFTRASGATYFDAKGVMQMAGNNEPRIDFDPATGECKGLLIEESRTNLLTYSEQFDHANWVNLITGTGVNPVLTTNDALAPDGTLTADKITFSIGAGSTPSDSSIIRQQTPATTLGNSYVGTVWLKGSTGGEIIAFRHAGNVSWTLAQLTTQWQRFSSVEIANVSSTSFFSVGLRREQTGGANTSATIYIWGAQLEAGSFPTSYIPTTTAAAARFADVAVISGTAFSDFYRQSAGSSLVQASVMSDKQNSLATFFGSISNRITLETLSSGRVQGWVRTDGVAYGCLSADNIIQTNTPFSLAHTYAVGDSAATVNGGSVIVSSPQPPAFPVPDRVQIGYYSATPLYANGHINRLVYWPSRLSNATLQQLTA